MASEVKLRLSAVDVYGKGINETIDIILRVSRDPLPVFPPHASHLQTHR